MSLKDLVAISGGPGEIDYSRDMGHGDVTYTVTAETSNYKLGNVFFTQNKLVACTIFPKQHLEKTIKGGLALIDKKVSLQELEVVYSNEEGTFFPGMKVFVRGDQVVQNWAKESFIIGGKEIILVPESAIQIVER